MAATAARAARRAVALACLVAALGAGPAWAAPRATTTTGTTTTAPTTTTTAANTGGRSWLWIVAPILLLLAATVYFRNRPGGYAGRDRDGGP